MKLHVKKNDTVVVVSGKDAGKTGEVLKVYPKTGRVLVQGVNIVKKHQKPSRANAQGGIIEKEGAIYSSKVMLYCTKCKNATGYEILLGNKYKTSAGEKYPVKKHLKRTGNTTTVTFTNVKKGTWYVTVRSWNRTSKNKSRVYSPYSTMKKFAV